MAQLYTPSDTSEKSTNLTEDPNDFIEEPPSPFVNLPTELWLHVFSYLEHWDLKAIRLTCKLFSDLARYPLMKESSIHICSELIDIQMFAEDQYLPFSSCVLSHNVEDEPEVLKIANKILTKHLKCLVIFDSSPDWIAEKPLPNLKEIIIVIEENNEQIESGKWRLRTYEKLEDVCINLMFPINVSDTLNLFEDILNPKFNLKRLLLWVDKQFEHLLDEVRKVYDPNKVDLELESFDCGNHSDENSNGSELAMTDSETD